MSRTTVATVTLTWVGIVAGSLLLSGSSQASPTSTPGTINACYDTTTGALRLTPNRSEVGCRMGEKRVRWGQRGPAGPPGPRGPRGESGGGSPAGASATELHRWTFTTSGATDQSDYTVAGPATVTTVSVELGPGLQSFVQQCWRLEFTLTLGGRPLASMARSEEFSSALTGGQVVLNAGDRARLGGYVGCTDVNDSSVEVPDGLTAELVFQEATIAPFTPDDVTSVS